MAPTALKRQRAAALRLSNLLCCLPRAYRKNTAPCCRQAIGPHSIVEILMALMGYQLVTDYQAPGVFEGRRLLGWSFEPGPGMIDSGQPAASAIVFITGWIGSEQSKRLSYRSE